MKIGFPVGGSFLVFCGIHPKMELYVDARELTSVSRAFPLAPVVAGGLFSRELGPPAPIFERHPMTGSNRPNAGARESGGACP